MYVIYMTGNKSCSNKLDRAVLINAFQTETDFRASAEITDRYRKFTTIGQEFFYLGLLYQPRLRTLSQNADHCCKLLSINYTKT